MLYCEECKRLYEGEACPSCGKKAGRAPQAQDWCLLYSGSPLWTDMAQDVLKQNDIPTLAQSSRGAAMAMLTGLLSGTADLYVPFSAWGPAQEIVAQLFSAVPEEEESLSEAPDGEGEREDEEG